MHTGEAGLSTAADAEIIDFARKGGWVVVTLDADFQAQIALEGAVSPSVIRVREDGLLSDVLVQLLLSVIRSCGEDIAKGAFVSATREQARVRNLPIGK